MCISRLGGWDCGVEMAAPRRDAVAADPPVRCSSPTGFASMFVMRPQGWRMCVLRYVPLPRLCRAAGAVFPLFH